MEEEEGNMVQVGRTLIKPKPLILQMGKLKPRPEMEELSKVLHQVQSWDRNPEGLGVEKSPSESI